MLGRLSRTSPLIRISLVRRYATTKEPESALVDVKWMKERIDDRQNNVCLVHVSWARDDTQYCNGHIAGARHMPKIADAASPFANMYDAGGLKRWCEANGIDDNTHVVLYDATVEMVFASRAWWMFRHSGHALVSVLDGGLIAWVLAHMPLANGAASSVEPTAFTINRQDKWVASDEEVIKAAKGDITEAIIDARPAMMRGMPPSDATEEQRIHYGRIPRSISLPYTKMLNPLAHTLLPRQQLYDRFREAGVEDPEKIPMIMHCNTGMRASLVVLSAHLIGNREVRNYDGSWSEYRTVAPKELIECD